MLVNFLNHCAELVCYIILVKENIIPVCFKPSKLLLIEGDHRMQIMILK